MSTILPVVGIALLFFMAILICFFFTEEPTRLQTYTILILLSTSSTLAMSGMMVRAQLKSPFINIGGPVVVFLIVLVAGMAFLDPELFSEIWNSAAASRARPVKKRS